MTISESLRDGLSVKPFLTTSESGVLVDPETQEQVPLSLIHILLIILLIAVPVLTMRSMSEEHRSRTDQLLLTSPVSLWSVVMGKYLSMVTVFAIPVAVSCLCPLIIQANGTAYLAEDYGAILTFFLLGCVYISIGLFISSLTESQLIAAAGTFGVLLLLILWPSLISFLPVTAEGSLAGLLLLWTLLSLSLIHISTRTALSPCSACP